MNAPNPGHNRPLTEKAYQIRRTALQMGKVQGQGYIAQALDVADILAVSYFHALNLKPDDPHWEDRDRFYLSIGHYAIALYAVLVEVGVLPREEVESYGSDNSRLPMSGMATYTPGMEITGGSLGQGLPIAVGACLGLKRKGSGAFVYNLLSDGELGEGSTWEAAMSAAHYQLDNLIAIVDVNNQQADGPPATVLSSEPIDAKWRAFGWHTQRVNGNDIEALTAAFDAARAYEGPEPRVIVCDTLMGCGVSFLEAREKNHFIRVDADEWDKAISALDEEFVA
ncbi:Transketolase 2 (plasmid) [Hartmannibacter diazotrophicus]|uniref:Transketolase 2 n=1 Tax=Hartmannibacter diazotrophicus TaxID=1482074 RepID=A0A2C9DDX5_9HYPH|nr:transketolase [Hartmannibacter diazotrophicus]SON58453.1 Transketolase 2 [Hartmannibacter diazotrophicus]